MHRSRPSMLAILAAVAACSGRRDPKAAEVLSKDPTLVATLEVHDKAESQPLPDACGSVAVAAQPASANRQQAEAIARQAYDAELLGNTKQAQTLLQRASTLDATDKSVAYHLGRTSEAVGDRGGALTAYCRYLALTPPAAEAVDARQRVQVLATTGNGAAVSSVARVAVRSGAGRSTHSLMARRGGYAVASHSAPTQRGGYSAGGESVEAAPAQSGEAATSGDIGGGSRRTSDGDVVATGQTLPPVEQPTTSSRSRGPSRVQSAGVGALAGAIIGAAAGRSVKSAVIGAAAGGIVGTVVAGQMQPAGAGLRPWAASAQPMRAARTPRRFVRYLPAA